MQTSICLASPWTLALEGIIMMTPKFGIKQVNKLTRVKFPSWRDKKADILSVIALNQSPEKSLKCILSSLGTNMYFGFCAVRGVFPSVLCKAPQYVPDFEIDLLHKLVGNLLNPCCYKSKSATTTRLSDCSMMQLWWPGPLSNHFGIPSMHLTKPAEIVVLLSINPKLKSWTYIAKIQQTQKLMNPLWRNLTFHVGDMTNDGEWNLNWRKEHRLPFIPNSLSTKLVTAPVWWIGKEH